MESRRDTHGLPRLFCFPITPDGLDLLSFGDTRERVAAWGVSVPAHRALTRACPCSLLRAAHTSLHIPACGMRLHLAQPGEAMVGMVPAGSHWEGQKKMGLGAGEEIWIPQAASTTRGARTIPLMGGKWGKARTQQVSSLWDFSTGKETHQNPTSSRSHPPTPTGHPTVPHSLLLSRLTDIPSCRRDKS